jgi:phosphinothricin acetyltransferase
MKASCIIRPAVEADLENINDIYNYYVDHSTCTYQEVPETIHDRRQWFSHHGEMHPVIVAVEHGQVLGWGTLSPFRPRSAYRHTVENSVYIHHQHQRRGIGALLLKELIVRARHLGHHVMIAGIDGEQTASVAIHEKFHFEKVGHLQQAGFKFGRWLDVIYMELRLAD